MPKRKQNISRKEKRKLKRLNKKKHKNEWFVKHSSASSTNNNNNNSAILIQKQQEEIEKLRKQLQQKEAKKKRKEKKRKSYEGLNEDRSVNLKDMEFDEDKEIAYLEKKLMGSKGGNSNKLMKELLEEDGFENDFLDMLDNIDKNEQPLTKQSINNGPIETLNFRNNNDSDEEEEDIFDKEPSDDESDFNGGEDEEVEYNDKPRFMERNNNNNNNEKMKNALKKDIENDVDSSSDSDNSSSSSSNSSDSSSDEDEEESNNNNNDSTSAAYLYKSKPSQIDIYGNQMSDEEDDSSSSSSSESSSDSDSDSSDSDIIEQNTNSINSSNKNGSGNGGGSKIIKGAYVPPHLRGIANNNKNVTKTSSTMDDALRRRMRGLINRLGVDNIEPVIKDILKLYDENSTKKINSLLIQCVLDVLSPITYVPLSCLIVATSTIIGIDLLAILVEKCVDDIDSKYNWRDHNNKKNNVATSKKKKKKLKNKKFKEENRDSNDAIVNSKFYDTKKLLYFISYIYRFNGINDILISSLTLKIIENLTNSLLSIMVEEEENEDEKNDGNNKITYIDNIDHIMAVINVSGVQLRRNEPSMVLKIVQSINEHVNTNNNNNNTIIKNNKHVQYMTERINYLKNNRTDKFKDENNDINIKRLKKWLNHFLSVQYNDGKDIPTLNISIKDILNRKENGRWWIIGASFMNNNNINNNDIDSTIQSHNNNNITKRNNPTNLKSVIFNAIMGAHDYEDALDRLFKLNIGGLNGGSNNNKKANIQAERLIIHVIIDCNARSKTFNPFYSYLAKRLCGIKHTNKFTITLQFWDFWKINNISSKNVRTIANYSKFLSHLIGTFTLSLAIFKVIEFHTIERTKELVLFLHIFMKDLIATTTKEKLNAVFERITTTAGSNSRDGGEMNERKKQLGEFENDSFFDSDNDDGGGGDDDDSKKKKKKHHNTENDHILVKNGFKWFIKKYVKGTKNGNSKEEIIRNNEKVSIIMEVLNNSLVDL